MSRHLLVIGAQRCGTTYLAALLDAHPEITMARPSRPEPKVFLSDQRTRLGLEHYRRTYFAHATGEKLLGDKSTSYLEDAGAPRRAATVLVAPEIVVVLRDPVKRAVSNWRFSTDNGLESRPLEDALRSDLGADQRAWDATSTSVSPYAYVRRGRYADCLDPWFATFPGHVHVCFLEDLVAEPASLAELYGRLGVDPAFRPARTGRPVNESREPARVVPAQLVAELRGYYADSDAALRSRLRRQLPWTTRDKQEEPA